MPLLFVVQMINTINMVLITVKRHIKVMVLPLALRVSGNNVIA